ncbi:MAG: hypothetical protein QXD82_03165 [Nitrososphaerales archaeon]
MQSKSKKTVSLVVVSIFVFSMFFASVPLALAQPSLDLNPTNGPSGTVVTIDGNGFTSGTYRVYFDRDGDERLDWNEPYRTVSVNETGKFTTTLTIPSVASGLYYIRADSPPYNPPAKASALFTVTVIIMNLPPAAINFTSVLDAIADIEGKLWSNLDSLKNEIKAIEAKLDDAKTGLPGIQANFTTVFSLIGTPVTTIAGDIAAIEDKLDALPIWGDLVTKDLSDITGYIDTAKDEIISTMPVLDLSPVLEAISSSEGVITSAISGIQANVDAIEAKLDDTTYGLSAIMTKLGTIQIDISGAKIDIIAEIDANELKIDAVKGVVDSIKTGVMAIEGKLDVIGPKIDAIKTAVETTIPATLADIKAKTDTIDWADVTSIKGYVDEVESLLKDGNYGLSAIKTKVGDIYTWLTTDANIVDDSELAATESAITTAISNHDSDIKALIGDLDGSIRGWTTLVGALDDIKGKIEGIDLSGLLTKTYFDSIFTTARLANIDLITTINSKLDGWFGTGGKYEKTAQIDGGVATLALTTTETTIIEKDVGKISQFTVTFSVPAAGSGKTTTINIYVHDGTNYQLIKTYTSGGNKAQLDTITVAGYKLKVTGFLNGGSATAVVTYTYLTYP